MNIGIVIKEVRKQKGLTQLELSEQANLSERTIQRIEKNEVEPTLFSLKSISDILGVDLLEIKNRNTMMFTAKILGLHLNDFTMEQAEKTSLEERLEKVEAHLSSIARTRNEQLKIRKLGWIIAGSIVGALIILEILSVLRVFGRAVLYESF